MSEALPTGSRPPIWIVGCGYSGTALADMAARRGHDVVVTSRSADRLAALERPGVRGVLLDPEDQAPPWVETSTGPWGVISMPPGPGSDATMAFALRWLQQHGCTRVVYWSATSVHGAAGGAEVHAGSPVQPDTARGRARAAHEADCRSLAASLGIAVDLVRLPGIHGPGRTVLERIRRGDYPLVDGGFMWSNRIHVADIASATLHILGSTPGGQDWLASDGTPFQVIEMVTWVCSTWALPMPPSCRLDDLPDSVADFWRGDRRCNPERLLQTGWRPAFPNYRVAMLDAWRQEGRVLPADALGPG